MTQPSVTGTTLNAGAGGDDIAKVSYAGEEYQVELAAWWNGTDTPITVEMAQGLPVQPATSTTWAVTQSGTWNIGTVTTVTTVSTVTNLAQLGGQAIAMGTGVRTAGTQRVTIATDDAVPVTGTFWQATQPVSGTVTANLGAVDNAVLDAIAASLAGTLTVGAHAVTQSGTWNITNISGTVSLPTGAATEATLAAVAGYLDTEIAALVTAVQLLDNIVAGNEAQVDIVSSALPTGAATAANQATANTALELIDNTVAVLGTATYVEATTSGNVVGAVRNDDLAALADTDNEIAPLQVNSEGALYTTPCASETKRASGVAAGGAPGTDDIVAGVASRKLRVLALGLFATSATVNNIFLDNADNDLLFNTGNPLPLSLDADGNHNAGFVLPFNPGGWFETDTFNEAITLNSSAARDIAWTITYIEVP